MYSHYSFDQQVVLITGAAGNLGEAVARAFHRAGATLVLLDYNKGSLKQRFPEFYESETHILADGVDVTSPQMVKNVLQTAVDCFGQIDILVNTVGGHQGGKPLHETSYETWDLMMNLNARSVFTVCHETLPYMIARQKGKIINIAAAPALKGSANNSIYGASKTAVARLTESMAAEYSHLGINVNAVLPWMIDTPQNRKDMPDADYSRWVTPDAIAKVILFLASSSADPINGVLLPVFGQR